MDNININIQRREKETSIEFERLNIKFVIAVFIAWIRGWKFTYIAKHD